MHPRVVIGAGEDARIPAIVCEYTIKKFCPQAEVIHTYNREDRPSRGLKQEGGKDPTRFSLVRFWVPELLGFQGRAIYLDSDMILFADIQELFEEPFVDKAIMSTSDPSVLLYDCGHESLSEWSTAEIIRKLDSGSMKYGAVMRTLYGLNPKFVGFLDESWNHRDRYMEGKTKLLHYTNMRTQPWPNHFHDSPAKHRHADLWNIALQETVESGMLEFVDLPDCLKEKINIVATSQEAT